MEGMQAGSSPNWRRYTKARADCDLCSWTTQPRPWAPRDSHCALISPCMRFLLYPVCRICALPELSSNWMISHLVKPLSLMNEPVEGELELILERQARWTCQ